MKNMMKKIALLSVVASLATPAFAGVVEYEIAAGDQAITELVFVAKTSQTAILRLGQPGFDNDLRDGTLDVNPEKVYGFAFGQPDGGSEANAWENYVINTVGPAGGTLQEEICGDATNNSGDAEQIVHARASELFVPEVLGGSGIDLAGSCVVTETSAEATVAATVKLAYEVLVSGGASIDIELFYDNGIEADLNNLDASLAFDSFAITETHYDASGTEDNDKDLSVGASMGHGDHGVLSFNMGFAATGVNAVPERRASAVLVAGVPL